MTDFRDRNAEAVESNHARRQAPFEYDLHIESRSGYYNGLFQAWDKNGNELTVVQERQLFFLFENAGKLLEACKDAKGYFEDIELMANQIGETRAIRSKLKKLNTAIEKAEGRCLSADVATRADGGEQKK